MAKERNHNRFAVIARKTDLGYCWSGPIDVRRRLGVDMARKRPRGELCSGGHLLILKMLQEDRKGTLC